MEIIDKNGYLESALAYIDKNIIARGNLQKIARKSGVGEGLLKNLSESLKNFSEKQFYTALQEKIEESHSSLSGASTEVSGADVSIEARKGKAFISMILNFDIVADGEQEDKIKMDIKIFSKNDIQIS